MHDPSPWHYLYLAGLSGTRLAFLYMSHWQSNQWVVYCAAWGNTVCSSIFFTCPCYCDADSPNSYSMFIYRHADIMYCMPVSFGICIVNRKKIPVSMSTWLWLCRSTGRRLMMVAVLILVNDTSLCFFGIQPSLLFKSTSFSSISSCWPLVPPPQPPVHPHHQQCSD